MIQQPPTILATGSIVQRNTHIKMKPRLH